MKYNLIETILGIIVVAVAVIFLIFGFKTSKINNNEKMNILAIFDNSSGLKIGDNVKVSGIDVGKIIDLKLNNQTYESQVKMSVDKELNLAEDSIARIKSISLLGGNYIEIVPGNSDIILKPNETIYDTSGSVSFSDLLSKMIFSNR